MPGRWGGRNQATGQYSFIGGGLIDVAPGDYAFVGAGQNNNASGFSAFAAGGINNTASGNYAIVAGGSNNVAAGANSFAAGNTAHANDDGCFVWQDNAGGDTDGALNCNTANAFIARASGGFFFYTNLAAGGASLAAGSGTWTNLSDRDVKQSFEPVTPEQVLSKLEAMPITTWQYKTEVSGARHMGPMAQDFYAAYGLGDTDKGITTIDADGVALASIQGLARRLDDAREQLRAERTRNEAQEERIATLEELAAQRNGGNGVKLSSAGFGAGLALVGVVLVGRRRRRDERP